MNGFYSIEELKGFDFKSFGTNVLISKKVSLYGAKNMSFGDNVRIDDFCIFVGNITIKNNVHVASFCGLHASHGSITFEDFSAVSANSTIYAGSDDYSGDFLTNPTIPEQYTRTISSDVIIGKHAIIGSSCVILPNSQIPEGTAIGAMSLVTKPLEKWSVYVGTPCKKIKDRSKKLLELEKQMKEETNDN